MTSTVDIAVIKATATLCAGAHVTAGSEDVPAQGVPMDGDWGCLRRELGRDPTHEEEALFEDAFGFAFKFDPRSFENA